MADDNKTPRLTLSMIVKNETGRYLERVLQSAREYITDAVIIDDGSTDGTVALCHELLSGIPHKIVENEESRFHSEWKLRRQQWTETIRTDPDWILFLDADEIFEEDFRTGVRELMEDRSNSVWLFRLYDFWDEEHYREDGLWQAHKIYRPFMLRYEKDVHYTFHETDQHCGRMPANVFELNHRLSRYRLRHYGWAKESDRADKFRRYMELDPTGKYGSLPQYLSILDQNPRLIQWEEAVP